MNWNGIAPFNEPCEQAPGYIFSDSCPMQKVTISGVCKYCREPYTRVVAKGNADRVTNCESKKCKANRVRARQLEAA